MDLKQSAWDVRSVAVSPDGKYALSGSQNGFIRIWDVSTGKLTKTINAISGPFSALYAIALSPDNKYILTGGDSGIVKLWDIQTEREATIFEDRSFVGGILSVGFSPDGKQAFGTGGMTKAVRRWNVSTGEKIDEMKCTSEYVEGSIFSPDGKYALFKGTSAIKLCDLETKELVWTQKRGADSGGEHRHSVAFSDDGKYILTGENRKIKLRDSASGNVIRTLLGHTGTVDSLAFSKDGRHAVSGSRDETVRLWDIDTGRELKEFKGHSGTVFQVSFLPSGKYILSGGDSSTRLWDVSTGEEVAMTVGFSGDEWIMLTRDGYYNSSPKGDQFLEVTVDEKKYTVDQFYDVFYRPDIVAAKMRGEDISGLITITMKDAIRHPPPLIEFTSILTDMDRPGAKVCYRARSTGGGIGEVRLFHNGKLIQSDGYYREVAKSSLEKTQLASLNSRAIYNDMRSITIKARTSSIPTAFNTKGELFEDCKEIDAISGENEVSVTAFNGSNTVQSAMKTVNFNSKVKSEEPHLYILSIGIDDYRESSVNLKYAVKDARDLEEKLRVQSTTLYKSINIHYSLLTDKAASKTNIINKLDELSRMIKAGDGFILFVAGHGVLLQNQYYLLTHDYNGTVDNNSMISSNEIVEASKKIKSLSQLLIFDTCHAGGVDSIVSGLYDARMSVLAKKMGLHIYASASDKQAAMDGYRGNGLFTYRGTRAGCGPGRGKCRRWRWRNEVRKSGNGPPRPRGAGNAP
ncbi:MAG: caspase family protein, partial [Syntrophales bacterium]|nr:caspase family protein [Syntrophales bacterium]